MPIKGLTDGVQVTRFPRLGKLRKGGEKTASGFGKDLDHFRFTSDRPEIVKAFQDAFGQSPATLRVYLPYATPEENFQTWKEKWAGGGLVHRCDGETMSIWLDGKTYRHEPKQCPYHGLQQTPEQKKANPPCDEIGRLNLIIPELVMAGFVGYVTLETHSINDIININSVLQSIYDGRNNELGLKGIEFSLYRAKERISVPGFNDNAARQRVDKWLVRLDPSPDWIRLQLEMQHNLQMTSGELPALPSGQDLVDDQPIDGDVKDAPEEPQAPQQKQEEPQAPPPAEEKQVDKTTGEVAIPDDVTSAMLVKTPKGNELGKMQIADLFKLKEWYNAESTTDDQRKANADLMKAVNTLIDWRMQGQ